MGLVVAVLFAVHAWQTRDLPIDRLAPDLARVQAGQKGVVYFFAPWCLYCKNSIDNVQKLLSNGHVQWAVVVALDYQSPSEVDAFLSEAEVDLPLVLGTTSDQGSWKVAAFPTYYVLDENGMIRSRSVGYSTYLGLLIRAWLA